MFEKFKKKREEKRLMDNFLDGIISGNNEKAYKNFQKVIEQKIKENQNRNNPFWH